VRYLLCLCLLAVGVSAQAQTKEYKISQVDLSPEQGTRNVVLRVTFTDDLDQKHPEDLTPGNIVSLKSQTSNAALTRLGPVERDPLNERRLTFTVDLSQTLPPASDNKVEVCFREIHFVDADGTPHANAVCGTGDIIREVDAARLERQLKVLKDTPQAKSSDEKNIFASGFSTKSDGGDAEGGAEIHLNSNDLGVPGLLASLHLRKATAEGADPKNFELELKQRSTWIFGASKIAEVRDALDKGNIEEAQKLTEAYRKRVLSSIRLDLGGKLEAEALGFDVTNFVGDGSLKILSRTKTLFGSRSGFYKFRLIPAGLEAGYNLGKADEAAAAAIDPKLAQELAEVDWITRFKAGAGFTLFYRNPESKLPFKRVEVDLQGVYRYLFNREVKFDESTQKNILTDRGHKPWFQGDLKFFLADSERGRAGFKLTFTRGSLPPVFATTKSFQFGIIFETAEDDAKATER
jgi:hypothetical protein